MAKILIVKIGAIGDVLRTTSFLPGLAEKYEPAQIDWLTSASSRELLEGNPYLRQVYTWEEHDRLSGYDLVIGLEDEKDVCRFVSGVGADRTIGAYLDQGRVTYTPSAWFDMSVISRFGLERANELKKSNRKTYQAHLADLLGIPVSPYVFRLLPDEVEYGRRALRDLGIGQNERVVGINTGAGKRWPQKSWGVEQTIELVKRLEKKLGVVSLILGGHDERERNRLIARETGMPDGGLHSLRGFAALVGQCQALLSSDSLAMHFGIATGRRLVVLFGPTSAAEIELYGLGTKISAPLDCLVCYKKQCELKPNCMDSLAVETVYESLRSLITAR
ncbi:MAG: glycosyltransferase family 9 protein [Candidatus Margulisbacteria bacterium]|jgi:heptosyltransferase-2|nr:glycosyltransferase family 9 protein [Candidatus Margulisiibacteriota bacterium]